MITIDEQRVYLTVGLPASGKTTWANACQKKHGEDKVAIVCKDDIRKTLSIDTKTHRPDESLVVKERNRLITDALNKGKSVIVADTNLNPVHIKDITKLVAEWNYKSGQKNVTVQTQSFTNVPLETCIERDKGREDAVGESVIKEMYFRYLKPKNDLKVTQNPNLPPVYLCDIDGTMALFDGKRSPFDTAKCENDDLNYYLNKLLTIITADGYRIIFVSGREEKFREETMRWFKKHNVDVYLLLMRKTGDFRDDTIVKREIFMDNIKDSYMTLGVFDDRPKVIRMWRELGLFVLNVGDSNEF